MTTLSTTGDCSTPSTPASGADCRTQSKPSTPAATGSPSTPSSRPNVSEDLANAIMDVLIDVRDKEDDALEDGVCVLTAALEAYRLSIREWWR